jgi:hypothetical protein
VIAALSAMVTDALRDRAVSVAVVVTAALLFLTAWVLGIAALVVVLARPLGAAGALAAVAGGLVILALCVLSLTRRRNRNASEMRAATRALWAATAANAASGLLRGELASRGGPAPTEAEAQAEAGPASHRSMFLIAGGLALILLGFFLPSVKGEPPEEPPDTGPEPDA